MLSQTHRCVRVRLCVCDWCVFVRVLCVCVFGMNIYIYIYE